MSGIEHWFDSAGRLLLGPRSIFCPAYLMSAGLVMIVWLRMSKGLGFRAAAAGVYRLHMRWTVSSRADFWLTLLNLTLGRLVNASVEGTLFVAALKIGSSFGSGSAGIQVTHVPLWIEMLLATILTTVAFDLASYLAHRSMHMFGPLWQIHSVHHSAEHLTPLTTFRQHPLEPLFLNSCRALFSGIALGCFWVVFPQHPPVLTVMGLGSFFFFYMFTVNLHHASVPVEYPVCLRNWLISPHVHHLHHSRDARHQNCNFGVIFSVWDRLLGTYRETSPGEQPIKFGLYETDRYQHRIGRLTVVPFVAIARSLLTRLAVAGSKSVRSGRPRAA